MSVVESLDFPDMNTELLEIDWRSANHTVTDYLSVYHQISLKSVFYFTLLVGSHAAPPPFGTFVRTSDSSTIVLGLSSRLRAYMFAPCSRSSVRASDVPLLGLSRVINSLVTYLNYHEQKQETNGHYRHTCCGQLHQNNPDLSE